MAKESKNKMNEENISVTIDKESMTKGSIKLSNPMEVKESAAFGKLRKLSFHELKFNLLLINGPNLNMLGQRDPAQYGSFTLADVEKISTEAAFSRGYKLECFQSNHEGAIIDKIHEAISRADGIVINPGALTHYSYAILDAIDLCGLPVIETHISDISGREAFRRISVTSPACCGQIMGLGLESYPRAVHLLCDTIEKLLR
jgi:3-dehydroquinate dehydratase-2